VSDQRLQVLSRRLDLGIELVKLIGVSSSEFTSDGCELIVGSLRMSGRALFNATREPVPISV